MEVIMKLKYVTSTGEVVCMGAMPDLTAGTGETVVDVGDVSIPKDLNWWMVDQTSTPTFRIKTQVEYDAWYSAQTQAIKRFDFNAFLGQIYATLMPQATYALCGFERPIEALWSYPNIEGIRPFLQGLVGQVLNPGSYTVLQSDMDTIVAAFTAQGITI